VTVFFASNMIIRNSPEGVDHVR